MSTEDDISAFLAKGGTIKQIPAGQGNSLKIGFSPNRDPEDLAAMKTHNQSDFVLAGTNRDPKPKRYGRK